MKKIIMSIKPEYVKDILKGTKKYEYRTKIPKEKINKIIIYCTSPVKKVIAEVDILDTLSLNPKILWEKTKKFSGIDKMFFNNYFKNRKIGHAYKLGKFVKYKEEKTLNDFGINYPPQSFCYIE